MSDHETAGDELVPAKPRNLPNRILKAFDNAMHLSGLPRGVKDTLAELCRFIPQSEPFATIFAHKSKIAERIGASERTVYRHLQSLQASGMVEVLAQERKSRNGRFAVARIRLTPKAAALIGFITPIEEEGSNILRTIVNAECNAPSVATTPLTRPLFTPAPVEAANNIIDQEEDASTTITSAMPVDQPDQAMLKEDAAVPENPVIHTPPSAILSAGQTLSVPTLSKSQPLQRHQNGLPIDLAWMTGNGVSRAGIFRLMGLAKAKRKRLSDIVTVVHDYIKDLKGGRLFSYLAALCNGPTDFAVAAANERRRLADVQKERALKQKALIFRERFKKTALTNREQTRLYLIDDRARFVQVFGGSHPGSQPLNDLTPWIEGIESGRLVLATLAVERRLSA